MQLFCKYILLFYNLYPDKATLGKPYDSTLGIPDIVGWVVLIIFLTFGLFITYKVRKELKKDKKKKNNKAKISKLRNSN